MASKARKTGTNKKTAAARAKAHDRRLLAKAGKEEAEAGRRRAGSASRELLVLRHSARIVLKRVETLTDHLLDARTDLGEPGWFEMCAITEARKIRLELKRFFEVFPLRGSELTEVER